MRLEWRRGAVVLVGSVGGGGGERIRGRRPWLCLPGVGASGWCRCPGEEGTMFGLPCVAFEVRWPGLAPTISPPTLACVSKRFECVGVCVS